MSAKPAPEPEFEPAWRDLLGRDAEGRREVGVGSEARALNSPAGISSAAGVALGSLLGLATLGDAALDFHREPAHRRGEAQERVAKAPSRELGVEQRQVAADDQGDGLPA